MLTVLVGKNYSLMASVYHMWLLLSVWFYSAINTNTHNMISWICGESLFNLHSIYNVNS